MEITLNITGSDQLINAINNLADAIKSLSRGLGASDQLQATQPQPTQTYQQQPQPVQQLTQQQPTPLPVGQPVTPTGTPPIQNVTAPQHMIPPTTPAQVLPVPAQQPAPLPVTPPSYTQDQLARAASTLMDQNRGHELIQLLNSFQCSALTELPQDRYGEFANALRTMGAQL